MIANGISAPLLLTFEGVALSVPAIYFFALFRNRVISISSSVMLATDQFLRHFSHAGRARAAAAAAPTRRPPGRRRMPWPYRGAKLKAEPNLVPILDMVFQLITFFLLVTNFKSAEIDLSLKLPVVGSARPVATGGHVGVVVLNIDKEGNVRTTGPITTSTTICGSRPWPACSAPDDPPPISRRARSFPPRGHSGRPGGVVSHGQPGDPGLPGGRFSQLRLKARNEEG